MLSILLLKLLLLLASKAVLLLLAASSGTSGVGGAGTDAWVVSTAHDGTTEPPPRTAVPLAACLVGMVAGSYYLAMINDWKLAKSLFTKEEFSGRLQNYTTRWARSLGGRNLGVAFTDGAFFNSQKDWIVKQVKRIGSE